MKSWVWALGIFMICVAQLDRKLCQRNREFSVHTIAAPVPVHESIQELSRFPRELFAQPWTFLGRGSQVFVFENHDHQWVIKFYRFPAVMRRWGWVHYGLRYVGRPRRHAIAQYNLEKLRLSLHSFALAGGPLQDDTGVMYRHLQPTQDLCQTVHLIDALGQHHTVPLDSVVFIIQRKGEPFMRSLDRAITSGNLDMGRHMLQELRALILRRCIRGISDLDNMDHDNYGWLEGRAIHLDVGRFREEADLMISEKAHQECLRVTQPLMDYLKSRSPELYQWARENFNFK